MLDQPITVKGATNFRDFGGHATHDGRSVVRGCLFRSNQLSRLTPEDRANIAPARIAAVVDLRSLSERTAQPTNPPLGLKADIVSPKADTDFIFAEIFADAARNEAAWLDAFAYFYEALPEIYADEYAALFRLLADGTLPVVIHCSAGKDRTGVACALILDLLGVDRADIVGDYLETSARLENDEHIRRMFSDAKLRHYDGLPEECRAVMLSTQADFIERTLDTIASRFGSATGYVQDRLGLLEKAIQAIRTHLLV